MKRSDMEQEWFIRQIMEGDASLGVDTICQMSEQLGIQLGEDNCCISVQFAESDWVTSETVKLMELLKACRHTVKSQSCNAYCYIGPRLRVVMVVSIGQASRAQIVSKIYNSISRRMGVPIQMGVGRIYHDLGKLSYSRVESYEALNVANANVPISYIDDIYVSRDFTSYKHNQEKRQIVELFKIGNVEQMKANMNQLVENVRAESPVRVDQPYPTSIRRTVVELLVEILHIGADAGVDVDALLDYQDPYSKVFQMADTPSILSWFFQTVELLAHSISMQHSKTDSNLLALAKKKIQDCFNDPELSLSLISSQLDITPTYFSAFFIREMGIGFNEYVTSLRIEKAKQMLSETNLKINSVATQCGFRSASYFIVVFRKQTGSSPSEYRNTKNQNK